MRKLFFGISITEKTATSFLPIFFGLIREYPALGTFGNSVLFLRVRDEGKGLEDLHRVLSKMIPVHLTQKFFPHVTWARNPKHVDLAKLLEKNVFNVEKEYIPGLLILFESLSTRGKTIYIPRAKRTLCLR